MRVKIDNLLARPDLLKSLITAIDHQSRPRLTEQDINSEAFAVL